MEKKKTSNTIKVNDEEIDVTTLSDDSILYLNHIIDLDKQLGILNFKLQQARTAKAAFLSMFNKSRKEENKTKE
jgi:hypothetical protein